MIYLASPYSHADQSVRELRFQAACRAAAELINQGHVVFSPIVYGQTPTSQERAALKRYEKEQEETRRWQYYEAIPQKHWRQMSGRQTKVLNEQAERYGIPFGGRSIITETDGMDTPGASSRESDKVTQLEARTRAYGSRKRIYLECTVSTQQGRTWQEYQNGTCSQILLPCPHCSQWVFPEREHLTGWRDAESQVSARDRGLFQCPECKTPWTEQERIAANQQSQLLHAGQSIDEHGDVDGEARKTNTLGFRWSAVHNLFLEAGEIAADEWRASRNSDEENAEREMRQFVWCLPVLPSRWEETAIRAEEITQRLGTWAQGVLPPDTQQLTAAIDLGKYLCHWVLVAWRPNATGHIADYGRVEVASPELGVEKALMIALQEFGDRVLEGWQIQGNDENVLPGTVWVDAGYMTAVVYRFGQDYEGFLPAVGRGASQQRQQWYQRPKSTGSIVRQIGEGYHLSHLQSPSTFLLEVNADHWKTWVHQRLATPMDEQGAMTLFQAPSHEHLSLAKHLTAEKKTEEFLPGKGVVTKWECIRRNNHWFDALYNACAAGHYVGARLIQDRPAPERQYGKLSDLARQKHDERARFFDNERWERMMERYAN